MNIRKILAAVLVPAALMIPFSVSGTGTAVQSPMNVSAAYCEEEDFPVLDMAEAADYDIAAEETVRTEKEKKEFSPARAFVISLIISLIIAGIAVGVMISKLKTVRKKHGAADYKKEGSFVLESSHDSFLYKKTNKTKRSSS